MDNSSVTSTDTRFEIVTWDSFESKWTTDGLGETDGNAFSSEREAAEAIVSLRNTNGDDWRIARYGVREIGGSAVEEADVAINLAWDGIHGDDPGWLVQVEGSSWQPGPDCDTSSWSPVLRGGEPDIEDATAAAAELRRQYPTATIVWENREL